jgi:hypothetical protein
VSKCCCYFICICLFVLHTSSLIFSLNHSEPIENFVDIITRFNFRPNESSYVAHKYMHLRIGIIPRLKNHHFRSIINGFVYVIEAVFFCEVLGKKLLDLLYMSLRFQKIKLIGYTFKRLALRESIRCIKCGSVHSLKLVPPCIWV